MKIISSVLAVLAIVIVLCTGCSDSMVASRNLSKSADMFELNRRVVFYNGITGEYMLSIEGRISIENDTYDKQLEVTCKTGPNTFKKHYLGLSDNVTYFCEQLDSSQVDVYRYKVFFKPKSIVPDVDLLN